MLPLTYLYEDAEEGWGGVMATIVITMCLIPMRGGGGIEQRREEEEVGN